MTHGTNTSSEGVSPTADRLSELVHDFRHCLHVLRIGRELLGTVEELEKRREICESMAAEERNATALLDELVALARAGLNSKDRA